MSETPKDKALAKGKPPRRIFVSFARDPLNPGRDYFEAHAWLYQMDAEADSNEPIYEYVLRRKEKAR